VRRQWFAPLSNAATPSQGMTGTPEELARQHPWLRSAFCKGMAIRGETRLALNADRPTDPDN